jgi:hypothetical protein
MFAMDRQECAPNSFTLPVLASHQTYSFNLYIASPGDVTPTDPKLRFAVAAPSSDRRRESP